MENYEVKGVSQASEIRKAYEEAVAQNIKYYRAVSNSGKVYGWNTEISNPDGTKGHFVLAQAGQEWFENDKYVEPVIDEPIEKTDDEIIDEAVNAIDEIVEETPVEVVEAEAEPIVEQPAEIVEEVVNAEPIIQEAEEPIAINVAEPINTNEESVDSEAVNAIDEIDYKALYEAKCKEFDEYKAIVKAFKEL